MNIINIIKDTESYLSDTGKVIYLTKTGSHLFGLNNENSDIDIKGLYIPSLNIKDQKPYFINLSTNKISSNKSSDIDIELFSIYKFFDLLKSGDTNALDLLFSIFSKNTILYETKEINILRKYYKELISSNSKGFLKYILSQTKKYGKKGDRFNSLRFIINELNLYVKENNININKDNIHNFILYISKKEIPYIKYRYISDKDYYYLSILEKEFGSTLKYSYLYERLNVLMSSYGNRSRISSTGIDYKSLTHAFRIVFEYEELITNHFITFPLKDKDFLMKIKNKDLSSFDNDYSLALKFLDNKITYLLNKKDTVLYDSINPLIFNKILIYMISI